MILVDFDRTLFDTDGFYEALRKNVEDQVGSFEDWDNMYVSYQKKFKIMNVFKALEAHGMSPQVIANSRKFALNVAPEYVYDDALVFLKNLHENEMKYTIFTYGDPDFQVFKLNASKLANVPLIVTTSPKHGHEALKTASIYIDDNPNEIEPYLQNAKSLCKVYRINRPNTKYADNTVASHTSLTTIKSLLDEKLLLDIARSL